MSLAAKPPASEQRTTRQLWKAPITKARWLWLICSIVLYVIIFALFFPFNEANPRVAPGDNSMLFFFGIVALVIFLGAASFSLRSRFIRSLPGKAQDWLWMHTWISIATVFIVMLHSNYAHILSNQYFDPLHCVGDAYCGGTSLYILIFLVISGLIGRLLDLWQARVIARDASMNGAGIARALKEEILKREYVVERLSAGKSEPFKQYCIEAVNGESIGETSLLDGLLSTVRQPKLLAPPAPVLSADEQPDFQQAREVLTERSRLVQSLRKQERARLIMRTWRYIHIALACLALFFILLHSTMELLSHGLHIIPIQQSAG